jgi:hypothetical protein
MINPYTINITKDVIQIGCEQHTHKKWLSFDDERIREMDGSEAITWWRDHKETVLKLTETKELTQ